MFHSLACISHVFYLKQDIVYHTKTYLYKISAIFEQITKITPKVSEHSIIPTLSINMIVERNKITWIVSVWTGKCPAMVTHVASAPTVIHYNSFFYRTDGKNTDVRHKPLIHWLTFLAIDLSGNIPYPYMPTPPDYPESPMARYRVNLPASHMGDQISQIKVV